MTSPSPNVSSADDIQHPAQVVCEQCNNIRQTFCQPLGAEQDPDFRRIVKPYYDSVTDLEASAGSGCPLCRLLWAALQIHYPYGIVEGDDIAIHLCKFQRGLATRLRIVLDSIEQIDDDTMGTLDICVGNDYCLTSGSEQMRKSLKAQEASGRQILRLGSSSANRDLKDLVDNVILHWVENCEERKDGKPHARCNEPKQSLKSDGSWHPTRLLYVGSQANPSLRLVESQFDSIPNDEEYMILSYCWGKGNGSARTTELNYASRRQSMDYEPLPKTIQDAIAITRAMSVQYLFVDAICIIQGSNGEGGLDWQREAPRMSTYYFNAFCTISASASEDASDGILIERPSRVHPVAPVCLGYFTNQAYCWKTMINNKPGQYSYLPASLRDGSAQHENSPSSSPLDARFGAYLALPIPEFSHVRGCSLYQRGWVLQERLFSRRILHWFQNGLFWECCCVAGPSEVDVQGLFAYNPRHVSDDLRQLLYADYDPQKLAGTWEVFIAMYSQLRFTYEHDKVVAIKGLTDRFLQLGLGRCIAGTVERLLPQQLVWAIIGYWPNATKLEYFPSWSWVSVSASDGYYAAFVQVTRWVASFIDVEDFPVVPQDNASGAQGRLRLRGSLRVVNSEFTNTTHDVWCTSLGTLPCSREPAIVRLYFDARPVAPGPSWGPHILTLPLGYLAGTQANEQVGLLLAESKTKGVYKRIGLFRTTGLDAENDERVWTKGAESVIEII
ncbi:hypothetical protein FALBO_3521 [Fusarium albosuccineum]|uniref:Heterokaryon incompatibility domain-containing protein n=1 Tax=Fusarium albosuccineum TaxID=1237068 RepID=A0A8H4PH42_9HYPO|nr:hypothetical protein FALBO_3521 [Fusarium albosuccineum]